MTASTEFKILGKTIVVTGGSRGLGLAVGQQLANKGANVVLVARDQQKLADAVELLHKAAAHAERQRFHHISADLSLPTESSRVISEVTAWNGPPDIVWCCAGSAHPTLFVDTPLSQLQDQLSSNYLTSAYMAHATLNCWLQAPQTNVPTPGPKGVVGAETHASSVTPHHIIFTSSIAAFFGLAGYGAYTPAKAALRALSDTLSQEVNLYAAAHPEKRIVRVHTVFPSTILGEALDIENRIKTDVTKMLEDGDEGQTSETIARKSIRALERGDELITTDFTGSLLKRTMLSGSRRSFLAAMGDFLFASIICIIVYLVRVDMDRKVRRFGRAHGTSGMKTGQTGLT